MKKYRPPLTTDELKELERLSSLDFSNYTEADVREEFLVPILTILGYRKELDYSVPEKSLSNYTNSFYKSVPTEFNLIIFLVFGNNIFG